jgi:hypothetical protein
MTEGTRRAGGQVAVGGGVSNNDRNKTTHDILPPRVVS